jgi:hypothetical protein
MWKKVGPTQNHRLEGVFEWIESGTHLVVIYLTVGINEKFEHDAKFGRKGHSSITCNCN